MKGTKYGKELLISVEVAGGFGNWYGVGTVVHGGRHCVIQVVRLRGRVVESQRVERLELLLN